MHPCFRHIYVVIPTWSTYVSDIDPLRPTENTVLKNLREKEKLETQLWYTLQSHYAIANLYSRLKDVATYAFISGLIWQIQL